MRSRRHPRSTGSNCRGGQTSAGKAGKAAPGSATTDCRGDEDETPSRLTTLPGNPRSQPPTTEPTSTETPSKSSERKRNSLPGLRPRNYSPPSARPTPPPTRSPDSEPRRQLSKISKLRNYTPPHSPSDLDMGTVSMDSINTTISPPMRHKHRNGTQNRGCGVTWVQAAFCQT